MPTPEQVERSDDFVRARSYRDAVLGYYDAEIRAATVAGDTALEIALTEWRQQFLDMAEDHGVSENTTP
jgi:hypothetical protein